MCVFSGILDVVKYTRKETTMKTFTGREIETMFGIPQQYRSRYDKAYIDFISPCDTTPRTYTENDVTVYQAIRDGHKQGRTRTAIAVLLVEMISKGTIVFHGADIEKYLQPQQPQQQPAEEQVSSEKGNGKIAPKKFAKREPRSLANLDTIVELSSKVGELSARNTFLEERISDLEWQIDNLAKVCEELRRSQRKGLFR